MIARKTQPIAPGHAEDDHPIRFRVVEKRLDELARAKLLPILVVCNIAAELGRHERLTVGSIENALEAKIEANGGIPIEHWAKACEILCPELYGEPPPPPRPSERLPQSRAMMAALGRRWEAGKGLRNVRDTLGLPQDRIDKVRWTESMIRASRAKAKAGKDQPADGTLKAQSETIEPIRLELSVDEIARDYRSLMNNRRPHFSTKFFVAAMRRKEQEVKDGCALVLADLAQCK
jgi:hypothetical protein